MRWILPCKGAHGVERLSLIWSCQPCGFSVQKEAQTPFGSSWFGWLFLVASPTAVSPCFSRQGSSLVGLKAGSTLQLQMQWFGMVRTRIFANILLTTANLETFSLVFLVVVVGGSRVVVLVVVVCGKRRRRICRVGPNASSLVWLLRRWVVRLFEDDRAFVVLVLVGIDGRRPLRQ